MYHVPLLKVPIHKYIIVDRVLEITGEYESNSIYYVARKIDGGRRIRTNSESNSDNIRQSSIQCLM